MSTNFEKWRKSVTVKQAHDLYSAKRFCLYLCPARSICNKMPYIPTSIDYEHAFYEWANQEAK